MDNVCCSGGEQAKNPTPQTVGEVMDMKIETARKEVERLCIAKAKLEAINLTGQPFSELSQLVSAFFF